MPEHELTFHPDALGEAERARNWYQERNPLAARGFVRELEHGINRIAESPGSWPRYTKGTRRYLLVSFPFSLVYRVSGSSIQILAVAHHKRRPGYWSDRRFL